LLFLFFALLSGEWVAQAQAMHEVQPGDTWLALAYRYGLPAADLQAANPHMNQMRQPTIGTTLTIPAGSSSNGRLLRPHNGNLMATAVTLHTSPWQLALQNGLASPHRPPLYQPIYQPGGEQPPKELPIGINTLELSQTVAQPGQAIGVRGLLQTPDMPVTAVLDGNTLDSFSNGRSFVALTGTGAFYGSGQPELRIWLPGQPAWVQPWQFRDRSDWVYQELTLTGSAAEIDQASIAAERERLNAIWAQDTAVPQWQTPFQLPISSYLEISSTFGDRRSYNGGPYRSYHEGVDFAAYAGTPVYAPAPGTVVIAEPLYVRGGAVIIDHGLGVYSGFYHLSEVGVQPGDTVTAGQLIGGVGTTGLSTGNHLHWDLLVDGVWVDAQSWLAQDMACWVLAGWGTGC
jgi:murein DD-endopeptidase MepM/ murein hydrolase activator NlpD